MNFGLNLVPQSRPIQFGQIGFGEYLNLLNSSGKLLLQILDRQPITEQFAFQADVQFLERLIVVAQIAYLFFGVDLRKVALVQLRIIALYVEQTARPGHVGQRHDSARIGQSGAVHALSVQTVVVVKIDQLALLCSVVL